MPSIFDLLFSSADLHNFAPEDKVKYVNDMTTERDIRNQIAFAQDKGYKLGKAEGKAEGRAEGIDEGRVEGIVEGTVSTARNLKHLGVPEDTIVQAPGLSVEEVAAL